MGSNPYTLHIIWPWQMPGTRAILEVLARLEGKIDNMTQEVDDLNAAVTALTAAVTSAAAEIASEAAAILAASANGDAAAVEASVGNINTLTKQLTDAVAAAQAPPPAS